MSFLQLMEKTLQQGCRGSLMTSGAFKEDMTVTSIYCYHFSCCQPIINNSSIPSCKTSYYWSEIRKKRIYRLIIVLRCKARKEKKEQIQVRKGDPDGHRGWWMLVARREETDGGKRKIRIRVDAQNLNFQTLLSRTSGINRKR